MIDNRTKLGFGVLFACMLCCTLPLIGGAALVGITGFIFNPFVTIGFAAILILIGGILFYRRRTRGEASCSVNGCGCRSCAK